MLIILILVWLFLGYAGFRFLYYGFQKDWYLQFKEEYPEKLKNDIERYIGFFIVSGGAALIMIVLLNGLSGIPIVWHFKIPK